MPDSRDPSPEQVLRRRRRAALESAAGRHPGLPDDVIDMQISKADFGAELLGGDPELTETAVLALEHNLQRYESVLDGGATPAVEAD